MPFPKGRSVVAGLSAGPTMAVRLARLTPIIRRGRSPLGTALVQAARDVPSRQFASHGEGATGLEQRRFYSNRFIFKDDADTPIITQPWQMRIPRRLPAGTEVLDDERGTGRGAALPVRTILGPRKARGKSSSGPRGPCSCVGSGGGQRRVRTGPDRAQTPAAR